MEDCAEKLNEYINNVNLRKEVGNIHKEFARTNYTEERLELKYKNIFDE